MQLYDGTTIIRYRCKKQLNDGTTVQLSFPTVPLRTFSQRASISTSLNDTGDKCNPSQWFFPSPHFSLCVHGTFRQSNDDVESTDRVKCARFMTTTHFRYFLTASFPVPDFLANFAKLRYFQDVPTWGGRAVRTYETVPRFSGSCEKLRRWIPSVYKLVGELGTVGSFDFWHAWEDDHVVERGRGDSSLARAAMH